MAVSGTTADCVYFGLFGVLPERPHVVVSGVNLLALKGRDVAKGVILVAAEADMFDAWLAPLGSAQLRLALRLARARHLAMVGRCDDAFDACTGRCRGRE